MGKVEPIRLAIQLAHKGIGKFRLGAVLVRDGEVVSVGSNRMGKPHPRMRRKSEELGWPVGIHAEVAACLGVDPAVLHGSQVFVARVRRDGSAAPARPCQFCHRFLQGVGVTHAHFTTNDGVQTIQL